MGNKASTDASKDFIVHEVLDKGTFGKVKLVSRKKDPSKRFVLKRISGNNTLLPAMNDVIAKEISKQQSFKHPNIAKIESFWYEKGAVHGACGYLLMEYCADGDTRCLAPYLGPCTSIKIANFMVQILSALVYAHDLGVIHRDIKLENILICGAKSNNPVYKLTDFGVSVGRTECLSEVRKMLDDPAHSAFTSKTTYRDYLRTRAACGTPIYMAPEMFSGGEYGAAVDVYALGLALREVLSKQPLSCDSALDVPGLIWGRRSIVQPYFHRHEPYFSVLFFMLCLTPAMLHRFVYTFLLTHVLSSLLLIWAVSQVIVQRFSDVMIAANPAARPTAAECALYLNFFRRTLQAKLVGAVILLLLFPFDAAGSTVAQKLTTILLVVQGAVALLLFTPSVFFRAFRLMRRA